MKPKPPGDDCAHCGELKLIEDGQYSYSEAFVCGDCITDNNLEGKNLDDFLEKEA